MLFPLIITLVLTLLIITIIVNAIQQHKERMKSLKRAEFGKLRHILDDAETMLSNVTNIPMSAAVVEMLLKRIVFTLRAMAELEPRSKDIKQRLNEAENRLKSNTEMKNVPTQENILLPDQDQELIQMIKAIKQLRLVLRAEHARGNIATEAVIQEDKKLEMIQIRINVESHIKRGTLAKNNKMLSSARQYYEKALAALNKAPQQSDYVSTRKSEMIEWLKEISEQLKAGSQREWTEKLSKEENKDLDELFAPKRKW